MLIAAATGNIAIDEAAPIARGGDDDIKLTATIHGGSGNLRQGIVREVLVRFDLAEGLHIYGAPVPAGMVATEVTVDGPPGLIVEAPVLPLSAPLTLAGTGVTLQVWSGVVDIRVPIYAASELATEVAPLDRESIPVEVTVRYQACDDEICLLPRTEKFTLEAALDVTEVPAIPIHQGHGQREGNYDGTPHWKRLLERKPPSRRPI
ncbi:MAG: protein-disulfide reductase DsbD domain-containing protein [Alphaproteobacteria bacterium]